MSFTRAKAGATKMTMNGHLLYNLNLYSLVWIQIAIFLYIYIYKSIHFCLDTNDHFSIQSIHFVWMQNSHFFQYIV